MPLHVLFACCILLLNSCSATYSWTERHPTFQVQAPLVEIGMPELGDRWILIRASWFSERLHIPTAQVYDTLGIELRETFSAAMNQRIPTLRTIPASILDSLAAPETQKLGSSYFLKGRFPAQGQSITSNGFVLPQLLLVQELTIGPDITREDLYDPAKSNQDTQGRSKKVKTLHAIASWSLWDNRKQHYLVNGISESSLPWDGQDGEALHTLLHSLLSDLSGRILAQIQGSQQ